MFPQYGPQMGPGVGNGYTTGSMVSQHNSLLGNSPFTPSGQPYDPNTTAPSSGAAHPAVQNMIKALKGGR
jgi:hypothetical protein